MAYLVLFASFDYCFHYTATYDISYCLSFILSSGFPCLHACHGVFVSPFFVLQELICASTFISPLGLLVEYLPIPRQLLGSSPYHL